MELNIAIAAGILLVFIVAIIIFIHTRMHSEKEVKVTDILTVEDMCEISKQELAKLSKDDNFYGRTDEEWEALYNRKLKIQKVLKQCVYGVVQYKIVAKDLIRSILAVQIKTEKSMLNSIDYTSKNLDVMIEYEILLYRLKKEYKTKALSYLIEKYGWDKPHRDISGIYDNYAVDISQVDDAYNAEILEPLTYEEMLDITATLVYQRIKGFGCIDTTIEMDIDGINCGISGAIVSDLINPGRIRDSAPRSVWIYYKGKYIHFRFLTFYTMEELRRVTLSVSRYNNPGSLTERRGFLVNTMWDQSRVLAFRPQAGEYWAFFIRKFSLGSLTLEQLLNPIDRETGIPIYKNIQLVFNTIKFLMICLVTCSFTGRQGSGKTTMMSRAVEYIDPAYPIRVLEMKPELYLRELYPKRNIFSVAETPWVTPEQLQDALKKSDAAISIVGEVATNVVAVRMLQMGQVASIFTIFSHHANTAEDLVNALTSSVVAESHGAATPETVLPQVIDVVKCDIHLDYDNKGRRYVERITEIQPLSKKPYPTYNPKDPVHSMNKIQCEYYKRVTDRKMFQCVDILRFNKKTMTYEVARDKNGKPVFFSPELTDRMLNRCPEQLVDEFISFVSSNWGEGA